MNPIFAKFIGKTEYANIYASNFHKEQATGAILQDETQEMKKMQYKIVNHNRKGYLMPDEIPFMGNSS